MSKNNEIIIYTDGSSMGNPGPAGWGAVILYPQQNDKLKVESEKFKVIELGGREAESTNNRMEMTGAIEALKEISNRKLSAKRIVIHTDSSYLINGITMWVYAWQKNNWMTKTKEPVLNKDLWEELFKLEFSLKMKYEIEWVKVSGHSGVHLNERCDTIATSFAGNNTTMLFRGNLKDYEKLFGEITPSQPSPFSKGRARVGVDKTSRNTKGKVAYSYVSVVNGKLYADKTWAECEKRVKGKSGAKYKKVFSREEEQDLVAEWTLKSLI